LIPLSLYEICYIQKFKVDRLFLFTIILYSTCFALRLVDLQLFHDSANLTSFQTTFMVPFVRTIQSLACLCLTYYILIIEYVKITIQSTSPQIMRADTKRHTRFTWIVLGLLFVLLLAESVCESQGLIMEFSILLMLFGCIVSFLCIRFIWIANYFL
jgi:hypothetical protein